MAAFDSKRYEDEVLKPLRRRMPHLPDDLRARYALDPSWMSGAMGEVDLRARVEAVVRLWNKHAMRAGPTGLVAQQLVREHDELRKLGRDPATAAFWRAWDAERGRRVGGAIDDVAELLTAGWGGIGVITADQLRVAAAAHGELGDADLARARERAGLRLVEPVALPATAGMRGRPESLAEKMLGAGADSVPRLLHPELTAFGLLDGLTVRPPAARGLDERGLTERAAELERQADSPRVRAAKEAVGMLLTEARAGTDLPALALFLLVRAVRERRAEGAQPRVLHGMLTRTGLLPEEAGRIAVSVLAETGPPARDPLAEVTGLLAEGRLAGAEAAAAALAGENGETARAAVARRRAEVEQLRLRAVSALRAGRDEEAGAALRTALGSAVDVPGLAALLASVPAPPVLAVSAAADGAGVRVSWRPAPEHDAATRYLVVRGEREPTDPDDGYAVPAEVGTAVLDPAPPIGRPVHYAVFAAVEGGRWSRPAAASVRVVPPVVDVRVEGGAGFVSGRWSAHPDAVAVEVVRTDPEGGAEPVEVQRTRAFHDESAVDGTRYLYSLVAVYPPVGGVVPRAEPVVVPGATRPEARPVRALTAAQAPGGEPAVRLSWRQRPGTEVVLRRGGSPCPWEYGAAVPLAELRGWGSVLDGPLTVRGDAMTLVAPVPPGRSHLVPFTLGPAVAIRGQDAVVDIADPVRRVRARRFGDEVLVTWLWPDAVSAADVTWDGGARRITLQQYRADGGCRLPDAPGLRRVRVKAVVLGGLDDESSAPDVAVDVDERPPRLAYELRRRGNRLVGGVRCTVTLSGAEPVPEVTVVLVGSPGPVMPLSAAGGIELLRSPVDVRPGEPVALPEITLPAGLRKPYWLRCFLVEPAKAVLVDPPVDQLKVA